ncbi:cytochrome c-type biogenesis protein [Sinimarinibacterium flocculans]|uniref:Cytochrome c-type biogenesis protein n=1 Tax=Sinimarinibacterium flocculans TaxID=985250 RepID=A0A318E961_9GAMM|nr:cytochrome c-type biogenesis protein [Sinimarinibacterium flocculans]PXV68557.1 cytochrome c-type biogenesis protein CcmH [Sinimarinibacterium flocculans]
MRHPTVKAAVLSAALLAAGALVPLHAQSDGLSAAQAERYQALVTELRCLVCQNQSIADSNAPLAADLREQVRNQILAGRSDTQIHDYVTERYGDFVLYRPPFKPSTWLLWFGPFLLLAAALAVALRFAKRRATPQTPPPVDRERLQRLLEDTRQ